MTTKQLQARYELYKNSSYLSIYGLYEKPSNNKYIAETRIKETMKNIGGYGYKVIGGNSSHFTAGWIKTVNDKKIFVFETYGNTYELEATD